MKYLSSLSKKKFREQNNELIIEGPRILSEAIRHSANIQKIFLTEEYSNNNSYLMSVVKQYKIALIKCTQMEINKICDSKHPQGVCSLMKYKQPLENSDLNEVLNDNIILLDNINNPGNFGTIIRTIAWFGYNNLFLTEGCVDPYNPKVMRAAMGGHFLLENLIKGDGAKLLSFLKKQDYTILAGDLQGKNINQYKNIPKKWVLVLGNEAEGLTKDLYKYIDMSLVIPGAKKLESLNVAEAGSILLNYLYTNKSD